MGVSTISFTEITAVQTASTLTGLAEVQKWISMDGSPWALMVFRTTLSLLRTFVQFHQRAAVHLSLRRVTSIIFELVPGTVIYSVPFLTAVGRAPNTHLLT